MGHLWFLTLITFLLASLASSEIEFNNNAFANFIIGRPYHGLVPSPTISTYYYNEQYYVDGGPIFLILGGESFNLGRWTVAEEHFYVQVAEARNASIFALEHRFYGDSTVFNTQTDEQLVYLSSKQAVEDAASFILAMNQQNNYDNPKWIVFGASYGGTLAMWLRQKHPELVAGVITSSSFSHVKFDYHEYLERLGEALFVSTYNYFHSDNCTQHLDDLFQTMASYMYLPGGRKTLSDLFMVNPRLDREGKPVQYKEMQMFFATIIANLLGITQYRKVNVEPYASLAMTPLDFCTVLVSGYKEPINILADLHKNITQMYTGKPYTSLSIDYDAFVKMLKKTDYTDRQAAASRSWLWQQCSELGLLVTTDNALGSFGSSLPSNFYIDLCSDVFGANFNVETISNAAAATNSLYGNPFADENATIAGFGGLTYDLWIDLEALGSLKIHLCTDTGHVADLYPDFVNQTHCDMVRQLIEDSIDAMIQGTPVPTSGISIMEHLKSNAEKKFMSERSIKVSKTEEWTSESISGDASLPFFLMGRPTRGFLHPFQISTSHAFGLEKDKVKADLPHFYMSTFSQELEHGRGTGNFDQRYWVNTQYYKDGGPLFLFIGGESEAKEYWLTNDTQIMRSAQKFNAAVYMLEHRYYGQSWPTETQTSRELQSYLNAEEALKDIASFITAMSENYTNPKWITFGGSYAGVLSAWFRQEYENLTIGAIASSAPIEIKTDFYEYLMVVERSIKRSSQGINCYNKLKSGFDAMFVKVQSPAGRAELSNIFSLDPPWAADEIVLERDIQFFFQNVFGYFEGAVQYNNDNRGQYAVPGGSIEDFCKIINNAADPISGVADAMKALAIHFDGGFKTLSNNYTDMVVFLQNYSFSNQASSRTWLYQTCHQFGYFQSSDIGNNFLGSSRPVNFFLNLCTDVFRDFAQDSANIYAQVDRMQFHYGGKDNYKGTNVVFINGQVDPWSALGEYKQKETLVIRSLNTTAHCADMYVPRPGDPAELVEARQAVDDAISYWLSNKTTTTSVASPTPTKTTTISAASFSPTISSGTSPSTSAHAASLTTTAGPASKVSSASTNSSVTSVSASTQAPSLTTSGVTTPIFGYTTIAMLLLVTLALRFQF